MAVNSVSKGQQRRLESVDANETIAASQGLNLHANGHVSGRRDRRPNNEYDRPLVRGVREEGARKLYPTIAEK